ncbi:hypothetical protein [Malonomonas rubra]|uniref:hypothetical protein n=1 Tax=Malonomonas rubra TaxID=57040 RepID=UPI0026F35750|nr:hypothetical protein [Malonomonas rubra]
MKNPLILKFLSGREERVNLLRPFHPHDKQLQIELVRCSEETPVPSAELWYIMVIDQSGWQLPAKEGKLVEHIETITGDELDLLVSSQNYKSCFLGFPINTNASYRNIFFTFHSIRQRREERLLSDIHEEKGWLQQNRLPGESFHPRTAPQFGCFTSYHQRKYASGRSARSDNRELHANTADGQDWQSKDRHTDMEQVLRLCM